jgi:hypothetical protein
MSLLTMIQGVSEDLGLPSPTTVVGNPDIQIKQLLQIANREGRDLASRFPWSKMVLQNTFTIAAAEDQGLLNSAVVSAGDFDYIIPETFWNQDTTLPIRGPLSWAEWESLQAIPVTGPFPWYLIRSGHLYLSPTPATGTETGAFEYKSTSWCETTGLVGKSAWSVDTDTGRLDENLMALGITWRWLKRKGLDYGEDFQTYEKRLLDAYARDGGRKVLNSTGSRYGARPVIGIPYGSWTV